ncbi:MAG: hypothetical protein AB3N17_15505, partial [Tateyamaria sp.]
FKTSKTFATAASHLSSPQIARLYATTEEFLATLPDGSLTDIRFDVALVDGTGALHVHENAFAHLN